MTLVDSLTAFTCKRFSRHVASELLPLEGGLYAKVQFWIHWAICPFCRRYWKEINAIDQLQHATRAGRDPALNMTDVKMRLKKNLMKDAS